MNSSVEDFLNQMMFSNEKNLQLDFFRSNGQVLLQVFKSSDVANWETSFKVKRDSFVFQLLFNAGKTNNRENYERFKRSDLYKEFEFIEFYNQVNYFTSLPFSVGILPINDFIVRLLKQVFELESYETRATLKAY